MAAPVLFEDDSVQDPVLPPEVVGSLLGHLLQHDFRSFDGVVAPALEMPRRREAEHDCAHGGRRGRRADAGGGKAGRTGRLCRQCCRSINKALAMELLCARFLAHMDNPEAVRSHCVLRDGRPHSFAVSGKPDLVVEYHPPYVGEPFIVVGEVSAKRQVDKEHFQTQLKQALKRSVELAEQYPGHRVFGLAINGGDIGSDRKVQGWWRDFRAGNADAMEANPRVSLLPMNAWDAAHAMLRLRFNALGERLQFDSGLLAKAFDDMINCLAQSEPPANKGWMTDMLVEAALEDLQLTDDSGGGGPPGTG